VYRFRDGNDAADVVDARTGRHLRRDAADAKRFGTAPAAPAIAPAMTAVAPAIPIEPAPATGDLGGVPAPSPHRNLPPREREPVVVFKFRDDGSADVSRDGGPFRTVHARRSLATNDEALRKAPTTTMHRATGADASDLGEPSSSSASASAPPAPVAPAFGYSGMNSGSSRDPSYPSWFADALAPLLAFIASLRRDAVAFVRFLVEGAARDPPAPVPVSSSAQAWIDGLAGPGVPGGGGGGGPVASNVVAASTVVAASAGASESSKPRDVRAGAAGGERGGGGAGESASDEKAPEKAPLGFGDLADLSLGNLDVTLRSADDWDAWDSRSFPDQVFVSDDEADQDAMLSVLETEPTNKAAFFDVDGTVCASNVVAQYAAIKLASLPFIVRLVWAPWYLLKSLYYLALDAVDRGAFNAAHAKDYARMRASDKAKREMGELVFRTYQRPRLFAAAVTRIAELKAAGYAIVLVTGSFDFLVAPLAKFLAADAVIANRLEEADAGKGPPGRRKRIFTGRLASDPPVAGEGKARYVRAYCEENDVDLGASAAFGDAVADLEMLGLAGEPHAVSPSGALRAEARRNGWPVLEWAKTRGQGGVEASGAGANGAASQGSGVAAA
jgi:HAD superfamily hydrolase (TIGR01490 family)